MLVYVKVHSYRITIGVGPAQRNTCAVIDKSLALT